MAEELCTSWFRIVAGTVGKTPFLTYHYSTATPQQWEYGFSTYLKIRDVGPFSSLSSCFTFLYSQGVTLDYHIIDGEMVGVCLAVMVFYCRSVFVAECYIYAIYLSFFFFFLTLVICYCHYLWIWVFVCLYTFVRTLCCCMFTVQCERKISKGRQRLLGWKH